MNKHISTGPDYPLCSSPWRRNREGNETRFTKVESLMIEDKPIIIGTTEDGETYQLGCWEQKPHIPRSWKKITFYN